MHERVVGKVCNLCEAMCGLRIHVAGREVRRIEPDPDDPLSAGAICPKAIGLKELHEDPDRVKRPLRRHGSDWEEISWDEALSETAERLAGIQKRHGNDAVASYLGNPGAHNLGMILGLPPLYRVLESRNRYSASSLDQNPRHATSILRFGNFLSIPVPDVDRTDFLLMLGANPLASGGSLMTAPGFRGRMRALRERGGQVVVVDPRRSETARAADEHWFIRPGADGLLLASLVHTVLDEKLGRESPALSPEAVQSTLGIEATRIRELARRFAAADSAVCYGRVGTSQHPFGTLATWLQGVLNLVTGNLDRPGGSMFPAPAADLAAVARMRGETGHLSRWTTRVRGAPCFNGEAPTACLAEEIATPGGGQVRGLLAIAGNPVLSSPNGAALGRALAGLEFFAAVDFYVNETTRHAHVLLPPTSSLEHENYEILFHGFAVRNTARFSPVVIPPEPGQRDDFEILAELAWRMGAEKATGRAARAALPLLRYAARRAPPTRWLDWMLRAAIGLH